MAGVPSFMAIVATFKLEFAIRPKTADQKKGTSHSPQP
jgi:hypothetical protein